MKLNIGNKILMLLHWLCSLMICVAFALCAIVPGLQASLVAKAEGALGALGAHIAGVAVLVLYAALSAAQLCLILRRKRRGEKGFIGVGSDDKGRVRIAVSAVEQMVRQSVRSIDGITDMKVDIDGVDDAIAIGVVATIASGAHVPTITSNMKRSITQFVEVNCGVSVQSVEITINAVSGKGEPSRLRRLGRGRASRNAQAIPQASVNGGIASAEAEPVKPDNDDATEPRDIWTGASEASQPDPEEKAPAFDLDKPYESEFAKDLAAMKARESAGVADSPED